jgi:hypothetical protein
LFYEVDFKSDDRDPLQTRLNEICDYANDVETKVLHRAEMNLFFLLVQDLVRTGWIREFGNALDIAATRACIRRSSRTSGSRASRASTSCRR